MHPLFWLPPVFLLKPFRKKWILIFALLLFAAVYIVRMITLFPNTAPMLYNYESLLGGLL